MKKWTHGHSLGTGALVGLAAASYRFWLMMALAFILGSIVTIIGLNLVRIARWLRGVGSPLTMRQWARARRRLNDLRPDDHIPF